MNKWTTNNCTIYQILKGRSNSFLLNQDNQFILIDTGRKNLEKELFEKVDEILGKNKLSYLILTHAHFDHVENAKRLKEKYNCKIIAHQSEAEHLKEGNNPLPRGTNIITKFMINMLGKRAQSRYKYDPFDPDILVDKIYDLSSLGFNGHIIHTPGHSKGGLSIIIDDQIAIAGDTIFGVFPNSAYPPFADNTEIMIESWEKLIETQCKLFLPGHGKSISLQLLQNEYKKYKIKLR